jgi:hypothetical protein
MVKSLDETYIGHRKGVETPRGGTEHKMKIVALVERGGNVRSIKVDEVNAKTLRGIALQNIACESELQTDKEFARHGTVRHRIRSTWSAKTIRTRSKPISACSSAA